MQTKIIHKKSTEVFGEAKNEQCLVLSEYLAFSTFPSILKASKHLGEPCIDEIHKIRYSCIWLPDGRRKLKKNQDDMVTYEEAILTASKK